MDTQTQTALASIGLKWNVPDGEAMKALAQSKISTKLLHNMPVWAAEDLRSEMQKLLLRGPTLGWHPNTVASLMHQEMGRSLAASEARLKNIARTEILDAYRGGAKATQMANADVLQGWVWMSVLGFNTCPSCIAMHGTTHDLSENGPDDHPQGRCYRMPLTKNWADLGIDLVEPPSVLPNAQSWFDNLDVELQWKILGAKRCEAYWAGEYEMRHWAQSVANPGWRRAFYPSKVEGPHINIPSLYGQHMDKIVRFRQEVGDEIRFFNNVSDQIAVIKKAPPPPSGPAWLQNLKPKIDALPAGDGEWQVTKSYKVIRNNGKLSYQETYKGFKYHYDEAGKLQGKTAIATPPTPTPANWKFTSFDDNVLKAAEDAKSFQIDANNYGFVVKHNGKNYFQVYNSQADHYFLVNPEGKIVSGPWKLQSQINFSPIKQKGEALFGKPFSVQHAGYKPSYGYGGKPGKPLTSTPVQTAKPVGSGPTSETMKKSSLLPKNYTGPSEYRNQRFVNAPTPRTAKGEVPIDRQKWAHANHRASSELDSYRGGGYTNMNNSYRGGGSGSYSARELQRQMEIHGHTFDDDVVLFRGVRSSHGYNPGNWKVGSTQVEEGFFSTTTNLETAANFGGFGYYENPNAWLLKVNAKPGQKWLPGTDYEYEVIFKPGQKFKVLKRDEKAHVIEIELL